MNRSLKTMLAIIEALPYSTDAFLSIFCCLPGSSLLGVLGFDLASSARVDRRAPSPENRAESPMKVSPWRAATSCAVYEPFSPIPQGPSAQRIEPNSMVTIPKHTPKAVFVGILHIRGALHIGYCYYDFFSLSILGNPTNGTPCKDSLISCVFEPPPSRVEPPLGSSLACRELIGGSPEQKVEAWFRQPLEVFTVDSKTLAYICTYIYICVYRYIHSIYLN